MISEIASIKIGKLMVYLAFVALIIPCGSSVFYLLHRDRFDSIDALRLMVSSSMYSVPIAAIYVFFTIMWSSNIVSRQTFASEEVKEMKQESDIYNGAFVGLAVAIFSIYLSLAVMWISGLAQTRFYIGINGMLLPVLFFGLIRVYAGAAKTKK